MLDLHLHRELRLAEQVVLRAAILTKKVLTEAEAISKADASPVTVADFAAQALMIGALHAAFPDDCFVGEEDAGKLRSDAALRARVCRLVAQENDEDSKEEEEEVLDLIDLGGRGQGGSRGRFWVMDPVDGTAAFLRNEQYAVALALIQDGREMLGVVCCPNVRLSSQGRISEAAVPLDGSLGIMLSAVRGQGASLRLLPPGTRPDALPPPQPLPRLTSPRLADIHMIDCQSSSSARPGFVERLAQRIGAAYPGTDIWSSHVRYASLVVAGGDAVLLRVPASPASKSCIWDHAGAQLIYTEMGGRVTDLHGKPMDFGAGRLLDRNHGLVAATADVHDEVLRLTRELMEED